MSKIAIVECSSFPPILMSHLKVKLGSCRIIISQLKVRCEQCTRFCAGHIRHYVRLLWMGCCLEFLT
jgi:hypothetical protein